MACHGSRSIDWTFSANDGPLINNCSCQEAVTVWFPYRFLLFTFICFNVQSFVWCEFNASFSHSVKSLRILYSVLSCISTFICFFFSPFWHIYVIFRVRKAWDFSQAAVLKIKWSISERRMDLKVKVTQGISALAITLKGGTEVSLKESMSRECVHIKRKGTEPAEKIKALKKYPNKITQNMIIMPWWRLSN